MGKTSGLQSMAFSRRTIVTRSVAGAAGAAVLLGLVIEASANMAQKAVEYQDTPKGDQECSNCSLFQDPNACTLVDGEISPKGWCKFWVKKQAKRGRSRADPYTKRRGTPMVSASPYSHALSCPKPVALRFRLAPIWPGRRQCRCLGIALCSRS